MPTNTQRRPSTARKVTNATERKRKAALNEGVSLTVDGVVHTVRTGDLSALDAQALRRECGYSFLGLIRELDKDADIDLIAAVVWLARRIKGEVTLSFAEVAADIGYDIEVDVKEPGPEEDGPEA